MRARTLPITGAASRRFKRYHGARWQNYVFYSILKAVPDITVAGGRKEESGLPSKGEKKRGRLAEEQRMRRDWGWPGGEKEELRKERMEKKDGFKGSTEKGSTERSSSS